MSSDQARGQKRREREPEPPTQGIETLAPISKVPRSTEEQVQEARARLVARIEASKKKANQEAK
jgi:hypothetical protein